MENIRFLSEEEMLCVAGGWDDTDEVDEIVVTAPAQPASCDAETYLYATAWAAGGVVTAMGGATLIGGTSGLATIPGYVMMVSGAATAAKNVNTIANCFF